MALQRLNCLKLVGYSVSVVTSSLSSKRLCFADVPTDLILAMLEWLVSFEQLEMFSAKQQCELFVWLNMAEAPAAVESSLVRTKMAAVFR